MPQGLVLSAAARRESLSIPLSVSAPCLLFDHRQAFLTSSTTGMQVAEEKATVGQLAKNWTCSYLGNFVGSLLMVYIVACTGLLATAPAPLNIAVAKTSLTFGQVQLPCQVLSDAPESLASQIWRIDWTLSFAPGSLQMPNVVLAAGPAFMCGSICACRRRDCCGAGLLALGDSGLLKMTVNMVQAFSRGVLCNWLVCAAVWMANACSSATGKAVAVWFPISAFVALGLEHSVANMFMVPLGIALGANVTYGQFLVANLLPVTLGNTVAGVACLGLSYSLLYGKAGKEL